MKKTLLSVLIITILVQLFVPGYMIWGKYDVLKNGQEVKIKVAPIDPYDAFRGRYVSLWYIYQDIERYSPTPFFAVAALQVLLRSSYTFT